MVIPLTLNTGKLNYKLILNTDTLHRTHLMLIQCIYDAYWYTVLHTDKASCYRKRISNVIQQTDTADKILISIINNISQQRCKYWYSKLVSTTKELEPTSHEENDKHKKLTADNQKQKQKQSETRQKNTKKRKSTKK